MLKWLRDKLAPPPEFVPADPEEAVASLRLLTSDAAFEEVWEDLDSCAAAVKPTVRSAVDAGELGEYPMHAAVLWLSYTAGGGGEQLDAQLLGHYRESLPWALTLDENAVVLGGALGGLDALDAQAREEVALQAFRAAGDAAARRFWLLLKVRTDNMLAAVVDALARYREPDSAGDPTSDEFVYTPTATNRMAGAFRQFEAADYPTLRRHFDLESPGARFLVDALGSTGAQARDDLAAAAQDPRPAVAAAATRWLRVLDS